MAVRQIAVTDTIEKFRTEFNAMTQNDFGDMAEEDFPKWKDKLESIDLNLQQQHVIKCSKTLFKKGLLSNNLMKNLKYINE